MQKDRVLLIAAGVTFYSLLAAFPAVAAAIALYGLLADPHNIHQQLALLTGIIPDGAVQVISDQIGRLLEQGTKTLSFALIAGLAVSLWGANAATKAMFDASARCFLGPKENGMPHNTESARATVLEPKSPDEATPMRNPVTHVHIVGAMISGVILVVLALIALC